MESFSTVGLSLRRKMSFWNDVSSATFAPMEIVPGNRGHFEGRLRREIVGQLALADVCSEPSVIHHTRTHIARAAECGYTLVAPVAGGFTISMATAGDVVLRPGEFCLLDQTRPYRLTLHRFAQTFCVGLGARYLREFLPEPDAVVGKIGRQVQSASRILVRLMGSLSHELQHDRDQGMTPAFAHSLASFIAAAYADVMEVPESCVVESRKRSIRLFIQEQLHDPHLRPAAVARHFEISGRYLRLIFESDGETPSAYILRLRLEKCARLLRDRAWRRRSITEIALSNGFNNSTHFGSVFRRRFGMTPREYRACDVGHPGSTVAERRGTLDGSDIIESPN
jgi:AraC family transcriptional activator of tynA and feaB